MKKRILICLIVIGLGYMVGYYMKENNKEEKYYFIQEGIYKDEEVFESNISNIKNKLLKYKDNKIYIYAGITKEKKIAEKIINAYKNKNQKMKIEEIYMKNEELKINIEQFDLLAKKSSSEEELLKIEEFVIANYAEIMKKEE